MDEREQAERRRASGMARADDHAASDDQNWRVDAQSAVQMFCAAHEGEQFLGEDVRTWAEDLELVTPPTEARAWGSVLRRAAADGLIRKVGYGPAKSSNLSPKTLWAAA